MSGKFLVSEIESGIPIPPPRKWQDDLRAKLAALAVGESVLTDGSPNTARVLARKILGKGKHATEKTGQGLRIWRKA